VLEVATVCVQTGLKPARHILESPLPVRPLSLPEFLRWCLLSRLLWFLVCFGKISLSDISIRNNQAASDWVRAVAKVPSKWRGSRKRIEFRPRLRVNCTMSLHPAGNIQLRVPHRPIGVRIIKEMPGSVASEILWIFTIYRKIFPCFSCILNNKSFISFTEPIQNTE